MYRVYKKCLVILACVFLSLGIEKGLAFGDLITLDAREDLGQSPGQGAFLRFVYPSGYQDVTATEPQWTSSLQVYSYAASKGIPAGWFLESAGNIWSSDSTVGESLTNLAAGIYRISPLGGAFMYDSFGWSDYQDQWRWQLHMQAREAYQDGQIVDQLDYILGSTQPYDSANLALQASLGSYIDIPLAQNGSLMFWIYDTNSIDNSGSLAFHVALVPEPSTLILLTASLVLIIIIIRRKGRSKSEGSGG